MAKRREIHELLQHPGVIAILSQFKAQEKWTFRELKEELATRKKGPWARPKVIGSDVQLARLLKRLIECGVVDKDSTQNPHVYSLAHKYHKEAKRAFDVQKLQGYNARQVVSPGAVEGFASIFLTGHGKSKRRGRALDTEAGAILRPTEVGIYGVAEDILTDKALLAMELHELATDYDRVRILYFLELCQHYSKSIEGKLKKIKFDTKDLSPLLEYAIKFALAWWASYRICMAIFGKLFLPKRVEYMDPFGASFTEGKFVGAIIFFRSTDALVKNYRPDIGIFSSFVDDNLLNDLYSPWLVIKRHLEGRSRGGIYSKVNGKLLVTPERLSELIEDYGNAVDDTTASIQTEVRDLLVTLQKADIDLEAGTLMDRTLVSTLTFAGVRPHEFPGIRDELQKYIKEIEERLDKEMRLLDSTENSEL